MEKNQVIKKTGISIPCQFPCYLCCTIYWMHAAVVQESKRFCGLSLNWQL